ncbi:hypothetical protein Bca4012_020995 [Brassica carinata]|uniref:Uncharacterized protein n=1 Tax=Brassica carinata TaxID=52824 RepID=A0A8X8B921_BRACI|nr:hypothetical protein Bca52824_000619 [Brassica carinata]
MAFSDDLPPKLTKQNRKTRTMRSKDYETLIHIATRAAHVASHKRHHTVSPEAIRCVQVLRMMRSLTLTPRVITKTNALHALQFLATKW